MTSRMFGTRLMAALTTLFNALALNLAMIAASLPLVSAPAAISAASATLDAWTRDGQDQVVRQFIAEFRARWSARVALGLGGPLGALVLGAAEVRHFARAATPAGRAGLCLAGGALLVTVAALGYLFQLSADEPGLRPADLWSRAARLALRNLPVAGGLSAVPVAGLTLLAARDPAVLLFGLPLFLLHALKLLARPGLRRAAVSASTVPANTSPAATSSANTGWANTTPGNTGWASADTASAGGGPAVTGH